MNKKSYGTGAGGITVFMVLAVLILAVFAVLTMSSAMMDMRLSEKNADMAQLYYGLDSKATKMLAAAEKCWFSGITDSGEIAAALYKIDPEAEIAVGPDTHAGICYISVTIPAGEGRLFAVEAYVKAVEGSPAWTIEKWTFSPASFSEEQIDTGLPVYVIQ